MNNVLKNCEFYIDLDINTLKIFAFRSIFILTFLNNNNSNNNTKMSSNRPLNIFVPMINNDEILGIRSSRRINQRRRHRKQRNVSRMYRERNQPINNEDILNRIETLSIQITNDPLVDGFFNGSLFI